MPTRYLYNLTYTFSIIVGIVLLKLSYSQHNGNNAYDTESNMFRFRDFQPRAFHFHYTNKSLQPGYDKLLSLNRINQTQLNFSNAKTNDLNREERGFHFHSTDKDLTVEIEFVIPLMRIPIQGGMQLSRSAVRNLLNLQSGSLLWAGVIVTVGSLIAGVWNSIKTLKPAFVPYHRNVRSHNGFNKFDEFIGSADYIASMIDGKLIESNIDLNSCIRKSICENVQKASDNVRSHTASSVQKILDGLTSINMWPEYLNGTAVHNAIEAGRNFDCREWKQRCKLPKF